jgi:adenylate cyclase class 2
MQTEIETRFLEINKDELVKKLISLGAIDKGEEKLEETIFHAADGSWVGKSKFVRLRKTKNKIKLTFKTNVAQKVDSAMEIELEVSDVDKCRELLLQVGLKETRKVEKYRHTFKLSGVTIDVDTWPRIPVYAEVEGPSVESLQKICSQLSFDWEKRFDGDARQVFIHYGYDFDKVSLLTFNEFKQE